jgi:hypothetical protein
MKSAMTKMKANRWQFRLPWQCSGTTRGASPNRACPGLHWKPLDDAIGQVPACIAPAAAMVNEFVETTQNINKTQLLASNYDTF